MIEKRLLVIGHPEFSTSSNQNKNIFYLLKQEKINQILFLEQEYNLETHKFNHEHSLKALAEADHIIFFHPIWWYSVPWTMKLWIDTVLSKFYALHKTTTKKVSLIITCGRTEGFYQSKNLQTLLSPLIETYQYMGWKVEKIYPLYETSTKTLKEWQEFANWINQDLLA